jgi:hypothetical protein
MANRNHTTVVASGNAARAESAMTRRGPGSTKVQSTRVTRPNPQGTIRSTGQQVRGPDKGAGSS